MKDFFAAIGRGDKQGLLALVAEDFEWIIPGEDWPLAGTHRGHAGLAELLRKASVELETTYDDWVFDITVRNGKVTKIREYIDTQALTRASEVAPSPPARSSNTQP